MDLRNKESSSIKPKRRRSGRGIAQTEAEKHAKPSRFKDSLVCDMTEA